MRYCTPWSKRFSLSLPLVVAPLGGGPTTAKLVVESCNAGALGSLAAAYLQPDQIAIEVKAIRRQTHRPFAINLFTPMPTLSLNPNVIQTALTLTRPYRMELGLREPSFGPPFHPDFDRQFEVVLKEKPAVFSFIFGLLDPVYLAECRKRSILTLGSATTPDEAMALEASGVDAVVAQGVEAGGHRAIFDPERADPGIDTLRLTRSLVERVRIPVISAGGIMDGNAMAKCLKAGAEAVQMGTAFLLCPEAGTSPAYRRAISEMKNQETGLTRVFSGRLARGLRNRFFTEMQSHPEAVLPFPAQNAFTRDLRGGSSALGRPDFLSLWAGSQVDAIRPDLTVAQLIDELRRELEKTNRD